MQCAFKLRTGIHAQDREKVLVIKEVLFNGDVYISISPIHKSTRISRAPHLAESQERCSIPVGRGPGREKAGVSSRTQTAVGALWGAHSAADTPGCPRGWASPRSVRPNGNSLSEAGTVTSSPRAKPHSGSPHRLSSMSKATDFYRLPLQTRPLRDKGSRAAAGSDGGRRRSASPLRENKHFNQNNPRRSQQRLLRRACLRAFESLPPFLRRL